MLLIFNFKNEFVRVFFEMSHFFCNHKQLITKEIDQLKGEFATSQ